MIHNLKIESKYFDEIAIGLKTFELRKNDRNYQIGDILELCDKEKSRRLDVIVIYIIHGPLYGLCKNYCCMSIKRV